MSCPILKPDLGGIKKASEIILNGGVIAFSTETFYGLGNKVEAILDGGQTDGGLGSTVLDIFGPLALNIREELFLLQI